MAKKEPLIVGDYTDEELIDGFKRIFEGPFTVYEDTEDECFRFFVTDEKALAWFAEKKAAEAEGRAMDPIIQKYEFPGIAIPGTPNFSATITPIHGDGEKTIEGSTGNYVSFRPNIIDRSKNDTNESVDVYVTITNATTSRTIYEIHKSNELVEINVDDYIQLGTNDIVIVCKGRASGASKTIVMTMTVFRLSLDASFNISKVIEPNTDFSVTYNIKGNGQKVVYFYIDGVERANKTVSATDTDANLTQAFINNNGAIAPGKHTLQMYAMSNGYPTDLLYFEFIIGGIANTYTTTVVSYRFPSGTTPFQGQVPGFSGEQYVTKKIDWAYFTNDPRVRNPKITWRLFNPSGEITHLATRNADIVEAENDKMPDPLEFMPDGIGLYRLQAIIEGYDYLSPDAHKDGVDGADHDDPRGLIACYSIDVIKNTNGVEEATEGLMCKVSGLGRSNDEPDDIRENLSDRGYSMVFHNMPWNNRSGYVENAVVYAEGADGGGAWSELPVNPFSSSVDPKGKNGCAVQIDYETFEVKDETVPLFYIGNLNGTHVAIYPTKAVMASSSGINIVRQFRANERHRVSFAYYPDNELLVGNWRRFMMMYIDGIRSAVIQYNTTDSIVIADTKARFGDPEFRAGLKLYDFYCYSAVVPAYGELYNFIINSGGNIAQLVKRNDIYVTGSRTQVDVDKLKGVLPVWELTGAFDTMIEAVDKVTITGAARYTDAEHPDLYMEGDQIEFKSSGESTLSMKINPSMHVKFNKGTNVIRNADGKPILGNRWTPFPGNVPERKIRLNADPMDSSHCHNASLQNLINEVFPKVQIGSEYVLRTPAQEYIYGGQYARDMAAAWGGSASDYTFPYKINYASDWKPVAVVWRPNEDTPYSLLGIYTMGEEKKADFAHGRRSIYLKKPLDDGTLDPFDFSSGEKGERGFDNNGILQFEFVRDSQLTYMNNAATFNADCAKDFEKVYQDEDDLTPAENNAEWQIFGNEFIRPMSALFQKTIYRDGIPYCQLNQAGYHSLLFSGRFNVWSYIAAYIVVLRFGLTDTLLRNQQSARFPKQFLGSSRDFRWWFSYWDLDMAIGLQQPSGSLVIEPCADRTTKTGSLFVFTGKRTGGAGAEFESSLFWDGFEAELEDGKRRLAEAGEDSAALIEAQKDNLQYMLLQMEDALAAAGLTVDNITKIQDEMTAKYGEALYNSDGETKYIDTMSATAQYLPQLQGDRTSHRHYWLYTSFEYWDAKNVCGSYKERALSIRAANKSTSDKIYLKAGEHSYFGWGLTSTVMQSGVELNTDDTYTFTIGRMLNANDPIKIYSPNKISELDLHEIGDMIGGDIELGHFVNSVTGSCIRKLIMGVSLADMQGGKFNVVTGAKKWSGFDGLTTLEHLDIQGYRTVSDTYTLPLTRLVNLRTFHAKGATGLQSIAPAEGLTMTDYQLPDTIQSMVMSAVKIQSLTFWHDERISDTEYRFTEVACPQSLRILSMGGMGSDAGAHRLFLAWLQMLSHLTREQRMDYQLTYTNVDIANVPKSLLLMLADMKLTLPSSIQRLTGYIKADSEYTTEEMQTLMAAFGNDIFTEGSMLIFDCDSSSVIISASGEGVRTFEEGGKTVVEVTQGFAADFECVGFPIRGNARQQYVWRVQIDNEWLSGNEDMPVYEFGAKNQYSLDYNSGILTTTELSHLTDTLVISPVDLTTYKSSQIEVRVVPRTYPTKVETYLKSAQQQPDEMDGVLQIITKGAYLFEARHLPTEFTGTMRRDDGGVWQLVGESEGYVTRNATNEQNPQLQFCLQVSTLPDDDVELTLRYTSRWNDNHTVLSADDIRLALVSVIPSLLINEDTAGNVQLFAAVAAAGVAHAADAYYSSMELKSLSGEFHVADLLRSAGIDPATLYKLTSGANGRYFVPQYMKNVTDFDFSDTGLRDNITFLGTKTPWAREINTEGTYSSIKF